MPIFTPQQRTGVGFSFSRLLKKFDQILVIATADIATKLETLREFRRSRAACGEEYGTVQRMVRYEVRHGLTNLPHGPSGCRTLLRLHRALHFNWVAMGKLQEPEDDLAGKMLDCYTEILAPYHPTFLAESVKWLLPQLPTRGGLAAKVGLQPDSPEVGEWMESIKVGMKRVFDITQELYVQNNLLDLP